MADDQLIISKNDNTLLASPAANIHGMLEVRGVGIVHLPYEQDVPLALAIELVNRDRVERMPEATFFDCLGLQVPLHLSSPFDASTPAKIRLLISAL